MHRSFSLLLPTLASANLFVKRDSWGPSFGLGPAAYTIVTTETTIYPGASPAVQAGDLWVWLGISNGTGDLIQSIVGSTPPGQSECGTIANADNTWCITSEVYGLQDGHPNQFVGDLRTVDVNYANGITFNYTLVDRDNWTWNQTMRDAVTGQLLATYSKNSGPMLGWGTALECNNGCSGTVNEQLYKNSKIVLDQADPNFKNTAGASQGTTTTGMETADGGLTWTIQQINIPAMNPGGASAKVTGVPNAATGTAAVAPASTAPAKEATSSAASATEAPTTLATSALPATDTGTASATAPSTGRPSGRPFGRPTGRPSFHRPRPHRPHPTGFGAF